MLDRVARLSGAPCLLARVTRLGEIAFYHVNGSYHAISASRGEINRENMAARGEFFHCYHLPVLSTEQNEEINVIDKPQIENRPVPVQEIKFAAKKFLWSAGLFVVLSGRSKDSPRSPLTIPVR